MFIFLSCIRIEGKVFAIILNVSVLFVLLSLPREECVS